MAMDFIAGCVGGCAGIIVGHPLDTIKVHIQTGRGNTLECTRALLKEGILSNAFRGVGAPLGGVAAINAIIFGAYGNTLRILPNPESLTSHAVAGGVAGMLQSLVTTPVELVKTRQQLSRVGESMPLGAWKGTRFIFKNGKLRSLFRGLKITIVRDIPSFTIYFTSYEAMTRGRESPMLIFLAGGMAGILTWVLLYPIDVVKCRIQGDTIGKYTSSWDCLTKSVRADGWRCLLKGLGPVILRAFISNGVCFTTVAWTKNAWNFLFF